MVGATPANLERIGFRKVAPAWEEQMSNQDFSRDTSPASPESTSSPRSMGEATSDAFSKSSDMMRDATAKAKKAASDTASTVSDHVKELLDRQIGTGANMAGQFASSAKVAADDLNQQSPVLAGLVRTVANKIENYAEDLQDQTVDQLTRTASDFTRRQPALVFGLAAVAGFFVLRTVKSAQSMSSSSPSIQPTQYGEDPWHKSN